MGLTYGQSVGVGVSPLGWWPGGPDFITGCLSLFCIAAQRIHINVMARNHIPSFPRSFCGSGFWAHLAGPSAQGLTGCSEGISWAEVSSGLRALPSSRRCWANSFP